MERSVQAWALFFSCSVNRRTELNLWTAAPDPESWPWRRPLPPQSENERMPETPNDAPDANAHEDDQLLASAVRFLIDGGDDQAASLLLACTLRVDPSGDTWWSGDEQQYAVHVYVTGPRAAYDALAGAEDTAVGHAIRHAISAVLPPEAYMKHFTAHAELVDIDPDWRQELLEIARGKGVRNQGTAGTPPVHAPHVWHNLAFRSASEVKIAAALDGAGALFFPNAVARLSTPEGRRNREPDFLVCHEGKWGVLEVDGEPFHPASRASQDHERDRLFKAHGIRVVEHFDANECYQRPDTVVARFLSILTTP